MLRFIVITCVSCIMLINCTLVGAVSGSFADGRQFNYTPIDSLKTIESGDKIMMILSGNQITGKVKKNNLQEKKISIYNGSKIVHVGYTYIQSARKIKRNTEKTRLWTFVGLAIDATLILLVIILTPNFSVG